MSNFARNEALLPPCVYQRIYRSTILIVGLGGVGSFACEAAARLGFQRLILIDKDVYEPSNLNRQLGALTSTIGQYKVDVMKQRVLDIHPKAEVIALPLVYDETTFASLQDYSIDFAIDAIDSLTAKWTLIKDCYQRNIPLVSSGGMANKIASDHIGVVSLAQSSHDPLSKTLRTYARKEGYDLSKIFICIQPKEARKRTTNVLPSLIFAPAISGLRCVEFLISTLITQCDEETKKAE